jgi:hypothetical protein
VNGLVVCWLIGLVTPHDVGSRAAAAALLLTAASARRVGGGREAPGRLLGATPRDLQLVEAECRIRSIAFVVVA